MKANINDIVVKISVFSDFGSKNTNDLSAFSEESCIRIKVEEYIIRKTTPKFYYLTLLNHSDKTFEETSGLYKMKLSMDELGIPFDFKYSHNLHRLNGSSCTLKEDKEHMINVMMEGLRKQVDFLYEVHTRGYQLFQSAIEEWDKSDKNVKDYLKIR